MFDASGRQSKRASFDKHMEQHKSHFGSEKSFNDIGNKRFGEVKEKSSMKRHHISQGNHYIKITQSPSIILRNYIFKSVCSFSVSILFGNKLPFLSKEV